MNLRSLVVSLAASTCMVGCVSYTYYWHPSQPRVGYDAIQKRSSPLRVNVDTEYFTEMSYLYLYQGDVAKIVHVNWGFGNRLSFRHLAIDVLNNSGVFVFDPKGPDGEVSVRLRRRHDYLKLDDSLTSYTYDMTVQFRERGAKAAEVKNLSQTVFRGRGQMSTVPKGAEQIEGFYVDTYDDSFIAEPNDPSMLNLVATELLLRAVQRMQSSGDLR